MASNRILQIENPARLSIDIGRLRIERDEGEDVFVAPTDIAVLLLHHHTVQLTSHALRVLADSGAVVIVTDDKHLPQACMLPFYGRNQASSRLQQQIALKDNVIARLWQSIVRARLSTEASTLRELGQKGALRLERLVKEVKPGDAGHLEGQAARHYWKHLFDSPFRREKQGAEDVQNAALNYGYAVLRSLVARELSTASLTPMLGLGHRSIENPFNLADDFIEPYRFVVERQVWKYHKDMEGFDVAARQKVLECLLVDVNLGDRRFRLPAAIRETVSSYCRILETGTGPLALPA